MNALEKHVTEAVESKSPEGAAIDFGIILQIVTTILQFVQNCPFGNARKAMKAGGTEATVAAYQAVKKSGYAGNAVELTRDLVARAANSSDEELDEVVASANSMPLLSKMLMIAVMVLGLSVSAVAGPFPEAASGPFPLTQKEGGDPGPSRTDAPPAAGLPTVPQVESPADDLRVAPPPPEESAPDVAPPASLRDRIAAYRARGGVAYYEAGGSILTSIAHMVRDHGWDRDELNGLSQTELDYLHGMSHTNAPELDGPVAAATVEVSYQRVSDDDGGYPVTKGADGNYHWHNPRPGMGHRQWHTMTEGAVYGGMTYRDGKMYLNSTPQAARQTPRAATSVPLIQWNTQQNCPNGQCPQVRWQQYR
jgi:hypothetical protein